MRACFLAAFAAALALASVSRGDDAEVAKARVAIAARLNALQNLHVQYSQNEVNTPPQSMRDAVQAANMKGGAGGGGIVGVIELLKDKSSTEELFFLHDRARVEVNLTGAALKASQEGRDNFDAHTITIFGPERQEGLRWDGPPRRPLGSIDKAGETPTTVIDLGLGLRMDDESKWLTADDIAGMGATVGAGGEIVLQKKVGLVLHEWTFDPKQNYALLKYRISQPEGGISYSEYVGQDFKSVDGVMLPMRIMEKGWDRDGDKFVVAATTEINVTSYALNDPKNTPDLYRMVWPAKAYVLDGRNRVMLTIGEEARVLTDADIAAAGRGEGGINVQPMRDTRGLRGNAEGK